MISESKKYYYAGQITGAYSALWAVGPDREHHVAVTLDRDEDETYQDLAKCLSWAASLIKDSRYKIYARRYKSGFEVLFPRLPKKINFGGYAEVKPASYEELWPDSSLE